MRAKIGKMECWSAGALSHHPITPYSLPPQLQFAKTLLIHCA
jgi:hypothetical protein